MGGKTPLQRTRGWYTVSVDTLRGLLLISLLAVVGAGAYSLYRQWEVEAVEREAAERIAEVEELLDRANVASVETAFDQEHEAARGSLEDARRAFADRSFSRALSHARRARSLLLAVFDAVESQSERGEAQFIAVEGSVEFRRGDREDWETARSRVVLQSGDYVKTASNGSAEIVFLDGTLYTVRPNTLFLVTRTPGNGGLREQSIAMEYGWVSLNTAARAGHVSTPRAEARIARESEAAVSYDKGSGTGRFASFRGGLEVSSSGGLRRQVDELHQVVQTGDLLSVQRPIPEAPFPTGPADNFEAALEGKRTLELAWRPVPGAVRYALQVSRHPLFVDNLIDVTSRAKTAATLGLRGEGSFEWRVAAIARDGTQGPWSEPRGFRVTATRPTDGGDSVAPAIEISEVQSYGNIFIVSGRTEAGATLVVNGEPVAVAANGSFTKTVQLSKEGWSLLQVAATDAAGNESSLRRRVFVESL